MTKPFKHGLKRVSIVFISLLLAYSSLLSSIALATAEGDSIAIIGNGVVDVSIDQSTGRYAITTDAGNPRRDKDENKPLLFGGSKPKTSFTTIRINGEDYIFGNEYGFMGLASSFVQPSTTVGLTNQSVWQVDDVQITQTLTLIDDETNPNFGNVRISYQVKNSSAVTKQVGGRILLDTMLGANDAAPITLSGSNNYVQTETEISGEMPLYWRAVDDPLAPKVMSYGFLTGWDNLEPDRFIIGHWEGLSASKWSYAVNENLDFTSKNNAYNGADSAMALYWDEAELAPGQTKLYETFYGLGSFVSADQAANYSTLLYGARELHVNAAKDAYEEETFEIFLDIDNSLSGAKTLTNVKVELGLPVQLSLAAGQSSVQTIPQLAANQTRTLSWIVQAIPQQNYKAARYWASVSATGVEEVTTANFVIMPGIKGAPPMVQVQDLLPNIKYVGDETHELLVFGKGFEYLLGAPDVKITLEQESSGVLYDVPFGSIEITDNQIVASLDSIWAATESGKAKAGLYTLHIDAGELGQFSKSMTYTNDESYQTRRYGLLAVVKKDVDSGLNKAYSIVVKDNEEQLDDITDEVLITIRGSIKRFGTGDDTFYEVAPGATINSMVRFIEEERISTWFGESQKLIVKKVVDTVSVEGLGVLTIPNFPFVRGKFDIKLVDGGNDYVLSPGSDDELPIEINWAPISWLDITQIMNFLPVNISKATLGDQTISFGGSLTLHLGGKKKEAGKAPTNVPPPRNAVPAPEEDEDEVEFNGIRVSLDEARFGPTGPDNKFGFIGLNAEGEVSLPEDLIPGMDFGAGGRLKIDTLDNVYELEAWVDFEVVEMNGLISIKFTDNHIPIPDSFVFAIGAQPGVPLVPPAIVGYITKAGGGFEGLYDTIMGNFKILPPLKLVLIGGLDLAKVIKAEDMRLDLSLQETKFSGQFDIADIPILDSVVGRVRTDDATDHLGVEVLLSASMSVFDIITGELEATFSYDSRRTGIFGPIYLSGKAMMAVSVPMYVPLLGGKELASVAGEISTEKLYARAKVLELPLEMSYIWGQESVKLGQAPVTVLSSSQASEGGLGEQRFYDPETGKFLGKMSFGTNIHQIASVNPKLDSRDVRVLAGGHAYGIEVPAGLDYALFKLSYSGEVPPVLTVTDGAGQDYELIENVNYLVQDIPASVSESGADEHYVYISANATNATLTGDWNFNSNLPIAQLTLSEVKELAGFNEVTASIAGNEVTVNWDANLEGMGALGVSLYVTADNETDAGILVKNSLDVAASDGEATFLLPEHLASGEYYVKAVLVDGDSNLHSMYSETSFNVVNPHEPSAVSAIELSSLGSGFAHVAWTYDEAEEIDGFALQALDQNGEPLPGVGAIMVQAADRSANIGGAHTDIVTGEEVGLFPGETYRVAITAFNEVGGSKIYSTPLLSNSLLLPEPNPAVITLSIDADQALLSTDEQGAPIYLTRSPAIDVSMVSNQIVDAEVYVNDRYAAQLSGSSWTEQFHLFEDGVHVIRLVGTNAQGDLSDTTIQVQLDTKAPDLKIESPNRFHVAVGNVVVKGVTEMGSIVTLDGANVAVDADGRFEIDVSMAGYMTREIVVAAEDLLGNRTEYVAEIVNQDSSSIEHVEIRVVEPRRDVAIAAFANVGSIDEADKIVASNDSLQLELIGIDESGTEYKLDPNNVVWEFLMGEELATLTNEGLLQAVHDGELVVKASYALSSAYALEDAFVVKIMSGEGAEDENGTGDEDGTDAGDSTTVDVDDLDLLLRNMLRALIESNPGVVFIGYDQLSEHEDKVVQLDDHSILTLFKQANFSDVSIGYGKVLDPTAYITGSMELLGDIYEFTLSKPIEFEKQPTLKIQIAEEDHTVTLGIYWYNEQKERWEFIGGDYDAEHQAVSAILPHFSKYALFNAPDRTLFTDIAGRWSENFIYRLNSIGVIDGIQHADSWSFEPGRNISRQEFIKLLVAMTEAPLSKSEIPAQFADRDSVGQWAITYLATAIEQKWLNGVDRGGELWLEPNRPITRAEAAALMAGMLGQNLTRGAELVTYADAEKIPAWAQSAISILQSNRIISGYPDHTFRPQLTLTREEAATMLVQLLNVNPSLDDLYQ